MFMDKTDYESLTAKQNRLTDFRERLKLVRGNRSQAAFSRFLGISRITVSNYESGDRLPDALNMRLICEKCNVSADWLLGLSEVASPEADFQAASKRLGLTGIALGKLEGYLTFNPPAIKIISNLLSDDEFYMVMQHVHDAEESSAKMRVLPENKPLSERQKVEIRDFMLWRIDNEVRQYVDNHISEDGSIIEPEMAPEQSWSVTIERKLNTEAYDKLKEIEDALSAD
jgi:transcriptional regulator with XRE-family HTH domain